MKGWNERTVDALESIASSLTLLTAAIASDGLHLRTFTGAEAATTTTTSTSTTSTTTSTTPGE